MITTALIKIPTFKKISTGAVLMLDIPPSKLICLKMSFSPS